MWRTDRLSVAKARAGNARAPRSNMHARTGLETIPRRAKAKFASIERTPGVVKSGTGTAFQRISKTVVTDIENTAPLIHGPAEKAPASTPSERAIGVSAMRSEMRSSTSDQVSPALPILRSATVKRR